MARSDKPEYPDGCYLCGGAAGTLHHVSYVPEVVILVCSSCHGETHSKGYDGEPLHPELQPDMKRTEWLDEYWDRDSLSTLQANQISWEDGFGSVNR